MTVVVPFDGTRISQTALRRAGGLATDEEDLVAVTVVPKNDTAYARERGWLTAEERFDVETIVDRLRERVASVEPDCEHVVETVGRFAPPGTISTQIKAVVRDRDARIVVIGSENAGRVVSAIGSVGEHLAAADSYDVYVVRTITDHERVSA